MKNIAMVIGYEGTSYYGFQTQPKGNTIQDKLEAAIKKLTGEQVKVYSSGRTDAGVHAKGQVINFHTESIIPIEKWCLALNARLPHDICAYRAWLAIDHFHARKSAKHKTYCYTIERARFPDIFNRHLRVHHPQKLDIAAMQQAALVLEGQHDFTSFCTVRSAVESHVRTVYRSEITFEPMPQAGDELAGLVTYVITGNGFLFNMVRIIIGTLLEIGQGKRDPSDMARILAAKNRQAAGPTAVSHGLMLLHVEY